MTNKIAVTFLVFIAIKVTYCEKDTNPLLIQISSGLVKGKDNGIYYSWESIPYAEAPVDDLRFEAPQPYRRKWSQVFDASVPPDHCMQWDQFEDGEDKLSGVEDCLRINIYRPKSQKMINYPVLIFIHGGCFMFGGTRPFEPDLLMATGRIMLVKISYRVGPLGFLSTADENITGNFGLKDQQLAIRWIKDNIANFGGDTNNIMLAGFSAGGASTHLQMLHPYLKDIAKVAVSFSGVALAPWAVVRNPKENAFKLGNLVNCSYTENTQELKKCLKLQKPEHIVTAVKDLLNFGYNPFSTFGPVVEHPLASQAFMTKHPEDIVKSGNFSHIPWLTSYAAEDGGYNAAELLMINPQTGKEFIYDLNEGWLELAPKNLFLQNMNENPQDYARELQEKYLGNLSFSVENYLKVQELYTDVLFRNGALKSLQLHSQYSQQSPVYGYVYSNPPVFGIGHIMAQRKDIEFGTNHMDDFSLVLNVPIRSPPRSDEKVISEKLIKMLIDFVETEKLSYGECDFEKIPGSDPEHLKLLLINRDTCETIIEKV